MDMLLVEKIRKGIKYLQLIIWLKIFISLYEMTGNHA